LGQLPPHDLSSIPRLADDLPAGLYDGGRLNAKGIKNKKRGLLRGYRHSSLVQIPVEMPAFQEGAWSGLLRNKPKIHTAERWVMPFNIRSDGGGMGYRTDETLRYNVSYRGVRPHFLEIQLSGETHFKLMLIS